MLYVVALIPAVLLLVGIRKLREKSWGYCKNNITLNNKVAIVTGANCGIGYEIAKELAKRNAEVILACRSITSARKAIEKMEKQLNKQLKTRAMELDLSSLKSIKTFAGNVQDLYQNIHLLVNNAGVAYPKTKIQFTEDGFEAHFGVNHLGHFYLTALLLDTLKKSAPSRLIVVTSSLHEKGQIHFDQFQAPLEHIEGNLYANSKLANVYFAKELAKRTENSRFEVYAVCPGWVYSSLFRHSIKWYHYILVAPIAFFFMRSAKQGAQTIVHCATDPNLTGLLYRNCEEYTPKMIYNDAIAVKLWKESEKMIDSKMQ